MLATQIKAIRMTASRKEKAQLIHINRKDEIFKEYLIFALSPYITFNVSIKQLKVYDYGTTTTLTHDAIQLLKDVANREVRKDELRAWLETLEPNFQIDMINMLNKTPRLGISGDTVLSIIPGLWEEFRVPLAYPVDWNKVIYPCYAQAKIDGLRCIYKNGQFRTRNGHIIHGLDAIHRELASAYLDTTELDGEIYAEGQNFDEISGKIRSFNVVEGAHYYIFDIVREGLSYSTRYSGLKIHEVSWLAEKLHSISVPLTKVVTTYEEAIEFYEHCTSHGFEGIILKSMDAEPFSGRKWHWQKVKPFETIDATVVGWEPGEPNSKYEKMVGSLHLKMPDYTETKVSSGMTDIQRQMWADNPELIIYKTVEIAFMEKSSKGKLRHPRLLRVRGDK